MVTMKSYEMAIGFSSMNEDELFLINGGSVTASTVMGAISAVSACVALGSGMVASAASTPVTGPVGVAGTVATWAGVVSAAAGVSAAVAALME